MKIRSVKANNHKRSFEVTVARGVLPFPYSKSEPAPTKDDPITEVYVDEELGREGFTYLLKSGKEGSIHVDSVLEHNEDPAYMRNLLLYKLTVQAQQCMQESPLSQAEILRRAKTSASQASRLLDPSNKTKSVDKLLVLLGAMDCEIEFTVRQVGARKKSRAKSA
jgi:predicted XRE-type DNA-binding protein